MDDKQGKMVSVARFVCTLLVSCAVSGAYGARNLHAKSEKAISLEQAYEAQVNELADMISTVFLVHHGSNLQSFKSLNISSVLLAAELGLTSSSPKLRTTLQEPSGSSPTCLRSWQASPRISQTQLRCPTSPT